MKDINGAEITITTIPAIIKAKLDYSTLTDRQLLEKIAEALGI